MYTRNDFVFVVVFAVLIVIALLTSSTPDHSTTYTDTTSYSSSNNWSSGQSASSSSWDLDTILIVTILVIGGPVLLSFKGVRSAIFGTAGAALGHPKFLVWFIIGFIGTGIILFNINPDPTTYDFPPILLCLGGGVMLGAVKSF